MYIYIRLSSCAPYKYAIFKCQLYLNKTERERERESQRAGGGGRLSNYEQVTVISEALICSAALFRECADFLRSQRFCFLDMTLYKKKRDKILILIMIFSCLF